MLCLKSSNLEERFIILSYISIILLAIALSIDACVVSFSYGITFTQKRLKNALSLAICTGLFQGIMPTISYYLTGFVKSFVEPYAGLIVFLIFTYLGVKIILEAFDKEREQQLCIDFKCLILVGIATSIDAFSAGITLSLFGNHILKSALLITFVTFANSILGFVLGGKLKHLPTKGLEVFAGLLLIALGVKALV